MTIFISAMRVRVIFFDVVRRYLESLDYDVNYVVNFTDVDDKLIRKAEQLGTTVPEVAERYIAAFYEDIEALGVRKATINPRVTENIPEIIALIEGLVDEWLCLRERRRRLLPYGCSSRNTASCRIRIWRSCSSASGSSVDERKENRAGFRAVESGEARRDQLGEPMGPRPSGLAYRMLGDGAQIFGRYARYPRRRP